MYVEDGAAQIFKNMNAVEKSLKEFLQSGRIDGAKMQDRWFPEIDADVFISHSSLDKAQAKNLAGYLKHVYGLSSFIDSYVWGYADDLLKVIDDQYCKDHQSGNYIYENRNGSTSHVHMMLATALTKMLDQCECVVFMNTPNSISSNDAVSKTHSPWIYHELGMIKLIREQIPRRLQLIKEGMMNMSRASRDSVPIDYSVDLSALSEINCDHLNKWETLRKKTDAKEHSLDLLYRVVAGKA
jgi:hypothetical protein